MVFRLKIFALKSGGEEGPLAAWVWDRRGGARIEGDLRAALLRQRLAAHQLLEVVVTSQPGAASQQRLETGQERLEAGQERLEAGQEDRLETGQERLETGQERLEPGEDRLEAGQERLEAGQERLEAVLHWRPATMCALGLFR
jgi:exonuclease VII small subunit